MYCRKSTGITFAQTSSTDRKSSLQEICRRDISPSTHGRHLLHLRQTPLLRLEIAQGLYDHLGPISFLGVQCAKTRIGHPNDVHSCAHACSQALLRRKTVSIGEGYRGSHLRALHPRKPSLCFVRSAPPRMQAPRCRQHFDLMTDQYAKRRS